MALRLGFSAGGPAALAAGRWTAALGWLRGRWTVGSNRRHRQLECVERLSLDPQHSLHLVRAAGRLMLISAWPTGCAVVADLSASPADAGGEAQ